MQVLERSATIPFDRATVANWHERRGAMQRLAPTWHAMKVLREAYPIQNGSRGEF
ncbi:MAG: hypothetical protein MK085_14020 [Phycisphaerales bacterium]|nr:hypothetical protein [Phycisphaerales bacterium]